MFKFVKKYTLIEWLVFLIIIAFNSWWPVWKYNLSMPLCYTCVLLLFIIFTKSGRLKASKIPVVVFPLFLAFVILGLFTGFHFTSMFIVVAFIIAYFISNNEGNHVISMLTKYLALSVIISLPLWLIHQHVFQLPYYELIDVGSMKSQQGIMYENYIFFIQCLGFEQLRFYSMFDEPGVLGTLSAFILWANHYDFKNKDNLIILIGAIFSYSMAFYIITIIGYILKNRFSLGKMFVSVLFMAIIGCSLFYILQDVEAFQNSIIYRFTNFEEAGVESRTSDEINKVYDSLWASSDLFLGKGSDYLISLNGMGGSYKSFIIQYGFLGVIVIGLSYLKLRKKRDYFENMTFVIMFISFLQRPDAFTAQMFILFSCIICKFSSEKRIC